MLDRLSMSASKGVREGADAELCELSNVRMHLFACLP